MSMPATATSFRTEAISPIQNKIGKALIEPRLRNMLAQPKSTITLRRLMDEGAIVICNLSKGGLGESTAHLLGRAAHHRHSRRPRSRAPTRPAADRRAFHLYADEFQSFATESFALILSRGTKVCPHAHASATSTSTRSPIDLRAAVFGNVGSIVACRIGATDAADCRRADRAAAEPMPFSIFRTSPPGRGCSAAARRPRRCVSIFTMLPAPAGRAPHRLIGTSRMRFGRPRTEVEARITKFLEA